MYFGCGSKNCGVVFAEKDVPDVYEPAVLKNSKHVWSIRRYSERDEARLLKHQNEINKNFYSVVSKERMCTIKSHPHSQFCLCKSCINCMRSCNAWQELHFGEFPTVWQSYSNFQFERIEFYWPDFELKSNMTAKRLAVVNSVVKSTDYKSLSMLNVSGSGGSKAYNNRYPYLNIFSLSFTNCIFEENLLDLTMFKDLTLLKIENCNLIPIVISNSIVNLELVGQYDYLNFNLSTTVPKLKHLVLQSLMHLNFDNLPRRLHSLTFVDNKCYCAYNAFKRETTLHLDCIISDRETHSVQYVNVYPFKHLDDLDLKTHPLNLLCEGSGTLVLVEDVALAFICLTIFGSLIGVVLYKFFKQSILRCMESMCSRGRGQFVRFNKRNSQTQNLNAADADDEESETGGFSSRSEIVI